VKHAEANRNASLCSDRLNLLKNGSTYPCALAPWIYHELSNMDFVGPVLDTAIPDNTTIYRDNFYRRG
jgi:hypothetical protein